MVRSPYLVQRCIVRNRPNDTLRFSEVAALDYMGAAEYEFGAVPESLRCIATRANEYSRATIVLLNNVLRDGNGAPLVVYSRFAGDSLLEYVEYLKALRAGKLCTKSASYFDVAPGAGSHRTRVTLWWDLTNDALFSFDEEVMRALPQLFANSLAYMDAQKRA